MAGTIKHNVVLDFESFYSKDVSITTLGAHGYLRHPMCEIYLVSVVADNGFEWVGHPKDFDWMSISGPQFRWLAHNYTFDGQCVIRLKELGVTPAECVPGEACCTADLVAYHALPRSLANACKAVFGKSISKDVRTAMKGRMPADLNSTELAALHEYALDDGRECLALWQKLGHLWPETERQVSRINREMGFRGIDIDVERLEWAIDRRLRKIMLRSLERLPWVPNDKIIEILDSGEKVKLPKNCAPLSLPAVAIECGKLGIPAPESMAADCEAFDEWLDDYKSTAKWVMCMRAYRRANILRKKCISVLSRQKADGRTPTEILYCGAGMTRRFSGVGGVNFQNLSRKPIFGVNLRNYILPCPK